MQSQLKIPAGLRDSQRSQLKFGHVKCDTVTSVTYTIKDNP